MKKRNRGGALLLVLLLTLGGAWPAYAAEPETPPPAATEESGLPEGGLPAPEPEEPPQPAPMISAVVTGFAGDGLPALPAVTLPVRQTGNSDDDLEPLYRLAVQHQSVTALVTAGEESRQEPLGVAWDFGDIDQTKTGTYQAVGRIELPEGVQDGLFSFAHRGMTGLHSAHSTKDGMGPCVFVWCNTPAQVRDHDLEAAVDEAIASGLTFSVPQADGSRREVPAKVIAVSDFYGSTAPENW